MSRKNTLLFLSTLVALVGTGLLLVANSVGLIVGKGGRHRYVYSQSTGISAYMRGCPEPHLPECGLVAW